MCIDAHVCCRLGDRVHAGILLEKLEPSSRLLAATPSVFLLTAASCRGMLAALLDRPDQADAYFSRAVDLTTGSTTRPT